MRCRNAGWVKHKLRLTDPDAVVRQKAIGFVGEIIDAAGTLGTPAIIGSMQGRWEGVVFVVDVTNFLEDGWFGEVI